MPCVERGGELESTVIAPAPPLPKDDVGLDSRQERLRILEARGIKLDVVAGRTPVAETTSFQERIESFVGVACVPIGIVGPLRVGGADAGGEFAAHIV